MNKRRFDWHDWDAKLYTSAEEIYTAFKSFGVLNKKIKNIHVIGVALNMEKHTCIQNARRTLAETGIPYDDIYSGEYPYLDKTLLPCKVEICEPVVFIFEDNSTLEIMPQGRDGLLMSTNKISRTVSNGTNFSNFNAKKLFEKIIGSSIKDITIINTKITSKSGSYSYEELHNDVKYQIELTDKFGIFFEQSWEGWFEFGLTNQYCHLYSGCKTADTTFRKMKSAANNKKQILIVEGHDGGGYFWIMPVKHVPVTKEYWQGIKEYRKEEISIDDMDISEFLYYFLDKYYDDQYPYGDSRDPYCENRFQWNLDYNIYTYDTMKVMLNDIEECCNLLKTDYDNPKLDDLKKHFSIYTFEPDLLYERKKLGKKKEAEIIKNNIYIAIEFYERFVHRMRTMMDNAKDYNLISFMGP